MHTLKPAPTYRDGEPCKHPGCLRHIYTVCECGRVGGFWQPPFQREIMNPSIDLYDTPIDLRPIPKQGPEEIRIETISECIEYLRQHGDHYGVQLLNGRDKENGG